MIKLRILSRRGHRTNKSAVAQIERERFRSVENHESAGWGESALRVEKDININAW